MRGLCLPFFLCPDDSGQQAEKHEVEKHQFFVSKALAHEYLGLEEVGDGVWSLHFYDRLLARFDERDYRLRA